MYEICIIYPSSIIIISSHLPPSCSTNSWHLDLASGDNPVTQITTPFKIAWSVAAFDGGASIQSLERRRRNDDEDELDEKLEAASLESCKLDGSELRKRLRRPSATNMREKGDEWPGGTFDQ